MIAWQIRWQMPKKFPPLTRSEIIEILRARGFMFIRRKSTHLHYEGTTHKKKRLATVDDGIDEYSDDLLKSIIGQSGLSREEFYCSTKSTAKKINKKYKL